MLGLIKALPLILLLAGAGYAAHTFIVGQLEGRIAQQEATIQQYSAQNTALQVAAQQNEATIRNIEARMQQQIQQMTALTQSNAQLQSEKEEYLSIFRRHDLQRLALARPGLIEPRINGGTEDVFRQLEEDSRELDQLNGTSAARVPDINPNDETPVTSVPVETSAVTEPPVVVEPTITPAVTAPVDAATVASINTETTNEQDDFSNFTFDLTP